MFGSGCGCGVCFQGVDMSCVFSCLCLRAEDAELGLSGPEYETFLPFATLS